MEVCLSGGKYRNPYRIQNKSAAFIIYLVLNSSYSKLCDTRLKKQGVEISRSGVHVKSDTSYTHENYIDDTQRQFINFGKKAATATSFSRRESLDDRITPSRQNSTSSVHDSEHEKSKKRPKNGRSTTLE